MQGTYQQELKAKMHAEYWTECWKRKTKIGDGEIEQKDLSRGWWTKVGGECTPLLDEIPFGCGESEFLTRIAAAIDKAPTKEVWVKPNSGCGVHMRFTLDQKGEVQPKPITNYDQWTGYEAWEDLCKNHKGKKYNRFVRSHLVEPILSSLYHVNFHVVDGEIRLILIHFIRKIGSYQHGRLIMNLPIVGDRVGVPFCSKNDASLPDYVSAHFERSNIARMQELLTAYKENLEPQFRGAFRVDFMAFPDGKLLHTGDGTTNIRNVRPCRNFENDAIRTFCFCDEKERAEAAILVQRSPKLREIVWSWISPWDVYDRVRGWCCR